MSRDRREVINREVGQIVQETGMSGDWINEVVDTAWMRVERANYQYEDWVSQRGGRLVKKYRERYPEHEWSNVVTKQNTARIKKLDILVEKLNSIITSPDTGNKSKVLELVRQMSVLIYGYDRWSDK